MPRHKKAREFHGRTGTSEHRIWRGMIERCHRPGNKEFSNYGGRGIAVCGEWRGSFCAFLNAVGLRPSPQHSLGRINNERGYEPGNVRWETRAEQVRNMRVNHFVTIGETRLTVTEWARRRGLHRRLSIIGCASDGRWRWRSYRRGGVMPRPRKGTQQTWYDVYQEWNAEDRSAALKVLEQIHKFLLKHEASEKAKVAS